MYKVTLKKEVAFWKSEGYETKKVNVTFTCSDKNSMLVLIGAMAATTDEELDLTIGREA
jgi:hypothetical protein